MRYAWVLLIAAGCRRTPPPMEVDASTASPAPIAPAPSASVESAVPETRSPVHVQVERWNDAHNRRDRKAFEALYAPSVQFYGQTLSNTECAKRKMAALAKSPEFTQSIHSWMFGRDEATDDLGATRVIFTKTTIEKGKSSDYIALLTLDRALRITEESDRTSERNLAKASLPWCMHEYNEANDRVRPPFKISAATALAELAKSKHMAALRAAHEGAAYGPDGFDCSSSCVRTEPRQCGFDIRIVDAASTSISRLVEWVYVDGITNVLWYRDLGPDAGLDDWSSEPLAP